MKTLEELIKELPPHLQDEVRDLLNSCSRQRSARSVNTSEWTGQVGCASIENSSLPCSCRKRRWSGVAIDVFGGDHVLRNVEKRNGKRSQ